MFTTEPLPLNLHQDWKLKLSEWAADGSVVTWGNTRIAVKATLWCS
jgi:hypothetical protein